MVAELSFLDHALSYRRRGWNVFPIHKPPKKQPRNGTWKKGKPLIEWKPLQQQFAPEAMVRAWFTDAKAAGIAVIFGEVSGGLASRDFDDAAGYDRWAADHAEMARTLPTVKTGRGFHVYFRCKREHYAKQQDGEYRGNSGHYSILPPSPHPVGVKYEWIVPLAEGAVPEIDPVASGLLIEKSPLQPDDLPVDALMNDTESTECGCSVDSVGSVSLCPPLSLSVHSVSPDAVEDLFRATLPTKPGERRARIFTFARGVKHNLGFNGVRETKPMVRQWHKRAMPFITTKDFEETWDDFQDAFKNARHGLDNLLETSMQSVDLNDLPPVAMRYESQSTRLLIGLMFALAKLDPRRCFFLSTHRIAAMIPDFSSPMTAWKRLRTLEDDGVIERLDKGNQYKAARFRWIGGELAELPVDPKIVVPDW